MINLKKRLIQRIQETSNPDLLKEVYRLLEIDFDDQEQYTLTDEQREAAIEGKQQIKRGDFLTYNQANQETEKWLGKK